LTKKDVRSFDHDRRIQVGKMQSMIFKPDNALPIDSPNALLCDTVSLERKIRFKI
jgi:hypothetical protein